MGKPVYVQLWTKHIPYAYTQTYKMCIYVRIEAVFYARTHMQQNEKEKL